MKHWENNIKDFITKSNQEGVRMIMVGGGAVNFHGYPRNSFDVDFWIDTSKENLNRLIKVFSAMGYDIEQFPEEVENKQQNISIKFAPADIDLELITNFSVNKSFDEAYASSIRFSLDNDPKVKGSVLSLDDLIISKIKAGRPKDLLDIQELNRIHQLKTKNSIKLSDKTIIDKAVKFHLESEYPKKTLKTAFNLNGALSIAFEKEFNIKLTKEHLKEVSEKVK